MTPDRIILLFWDDCDGTVHVKTGWLTKFFGSISFICALACSARADALDTWFVRNPGTTNPIYAVAYGSSNFVAVGSAGVLLTSTNGSDWVTRNSGQQGD